MTLTLLPDAPPRPLPSETPALPRPMPPMPPMPPARPAPLAALLPWCDRAGRASALRAIVFAVVVGPAWATLTWLIIVVVSDERVEALTRRRSA